MEKLENIRPLGSLIKEGAFGVLPPGDSYVQEGGIRFLRPTEFREGNQIAWDECLRAPDRFTGQKRARVKPNDILLAVKGATIAADKSVCHVEALDEPTIVNGSVFRFQCNSEVTPEFMLELLTSDFCKKQMKGALILNNAVDYLSRTVIDGLLVPIPPLGVQNALARRMREARETRRHKLEQARELTTGIGGSAMRELGLESVHFSPRMTFAVRHEELIGTRIDPLFHQPNGIPDHSGGLVIARLGEVASIDENKVEPPANPDDPVPYVGLPECDINSVREVVLRPYREVKGRSVIRPGNILFARIEPSVFNQKYVFAEELKGHQYAYTSTEFYVLRAREQIALQEYIYAMLFSQFMFEQIRGKTTGSSGRRRIDPALFASLRIPIPPMPVQLRISEELSRRRSEAKRLRAEAESEWKIARESFEGSIAGK